MASLQAPSLVKNNKFPWTCLRLKATSESEDVVGYILYSLSFGANQGSLWHDGYISYVNIGPPSFCWWLPE